MHNYTAGRTARYMDCCSVSSPRRWRYPAHLVANCTAVARKALRTAAATKNNELEKGNSRNGSCTSRPDCTHVHTHCPLTTARTKIEGHR